MDVRDPNHEWSTYQKLVLAELERLSISHKDVAEDISQINITLAKQEISLADHIRRTELLEESVELVRTDIKPLQEHSGYIRNLIKFIMGLLALAGSLATIKEIFFK